ncbi:TetR family transcriptional regulator [Asticcacaulis sp. ZE23SCel15]|uniref:TetR family transcriptional regulator n=1 Tax=Asticcacaulis sp. ZE23SCel15 TaxID=3059027 RepID=UPI00265E4797|nr:TetR family transcriptional regulator [Asticcacaulis sp. ZE23SCel15]WKL58959.1 TetR family transcriptional regulator [Asticcacaulis sp. ZE23SCel15]
MARRDLLPSDILKPALDMVAEEGLGALTLRPLAQRTNTSVSALTYHFGVKDDLLRHLISTARTEDQAFFDGWRRRLDAAARLSPLDMADVVEAILSDMVARHQRRTLFFSELVQASAHQPGVDIMLLPWLDDRLKFWRDLTGRLSPAADIDMAEVLHAYAIDETVHALALEALPAYRWLRRLTLRRLFTGFVSAGLASGDADLFQVFYDELGQLPDAFGVDHEAAALNDKQAAIVGHISELIVSAGIEAVTHRAVAGRAGVAASTLAYHFRTQEDLVRAGLEDIIRRLQTEVSDLTDGGRQGFVREVSNRPYSSIEIARATFAVALSATRRPQLLACAADMRRRRGINLHKILKAEFPDPRFDPLAAQALSVAAIGQIILSGSKGHVEASRDATERLETLSGVVRQKLS